MPDGEDPRPAHHRPSHRGRDKSSVQRGLRLGTRVIASLLSILVLVAGGWAWATYRSFTAEIRRLDAIPTTKGGHKPDVDGKAQNILIVGNDDRDTASDAELKELGTTRDGGSYNTDTMMLMHIPADGSRATVISFPRDSYVSIPGHGMNKLNAAYVFGTGDAGGKKSGGAQLLIATIEKLTGLTVDHFVQVDLIGFFRISKAIHGVPVCLKQAVREPNSGINLPAGTTKIEGKQALAFVRQRYLFPDGMGDLDRIKRQQYFLAAAFRKLTSEGLLLKPLELRHVLKAVASSLQMDKTLDPLKLAQIFSNIATSNVTFSTIPTNGLDDVDVGSVVLVQPGAVKAWVDKMIGVEPDPKLAAARTVSPRTVTVTVRYGSDAANAARMNTTTLRGIGFSVGTVGNNPSGVTDTTTIEYPDGMQSQAKTLARYVPGAQLSKTASVDGVTLVLGADGVRVKALSPASGNTTPSKKPTSARTPGVTTAADGGCIY